MLRVIIWRSELEIEVEEIKGLAEDIGLLNSTFYGSVAIICA